jgi:hypothetical protein
MFIIYSQTGVAYMCLACLVMQAGNPSQNIARMLGAEKSLDTDSDSRTVS